MIKNLWTFQKAFIPKDFSFRLEAHMNHDEEQGSLFLERALKSQINLTLFLRDSCVLSVLLRRRKKTLK